MSALQKELEHAGYLLCSALDSYLDTCHSIQKFYQQANNAGGVLQGLSASIASQISLIDKLYKKKIKQAKSTLGQVVNSPSIVPINTLPSEILISIFHLVVGRRPCVVKRSSNGKTMFPKYPDSLSHVCTRWRRIVLDSPILWSHIDIIPYSPGSAGLEARAEASAARAGDSLLDLHVSEPTALIADNYNFNNTLNCLYNIALRTRSLEYIIPATSTRFDGALIDYCLRNCVPGILTELTIMNHGSLARFIESTEDPEDVLLPVTVLRLKGVFFPWGRHGVHVAYHGLVELHLDSNYTKEFEFRQFSESHLVKILSLSPRLRVFHFNLLITHTLLESSSISPVHLDDLEVFNLTVVEHDPLTFLRLMSPGSKLLRLSLKFDDIPAGINQLMSGSLKDFMARSNVADLHISGVCDLTYRSISELISSKSNLQVLAITGDVSGPANYPTSDSDSYAALPAGSHLGRLYLMLGQVELDGLQRFIRQHPVNELVFWECSVIDIDGREQSQEELQSIFSTICPVVICIDDGEPNPIEDWD